MCTFEDRQVFARDGHLLTLDTGRWENVEGSADWEQKDELNPAAPTDGAILITQIYNRFKMCFKTWYVAGLRQQIIRIPQLSTCVVLGDSVCTLSLEDAHILSEGVCWSPELQKSQVAMLPHLCFFRFLLPHSHYDLTPQKKTNIFRVYSHKAYTPEAILQDVLSDAEVKIR